MNVTYYLRDEGSCYRARGVYGVLENLEAPSSDIDFGTAAGERLRNHQATRIGASESQHYRLRWKGNETYIPVPPPVMRATWSLSCESLDTIVIRKVDAEKNFFS